MKDASAVAEAGAFALVVEGTVEPLARAITQSVTGADHRHRRISRLRRANPRHRGCARACLAAFTPKFVKRLWPRLGDCGRSEAVQPMPRMCAARRFPGPEHCFAPRGPR